MKINFDELNDEDILHLRDVNISILDEFEKEMQENFKKAEELENNLPDEQKITNLNVSMKAKLLFIAKKIVMNAVPIKLFGFDPMFLDSDYTPILDTPQARYIKFSRMNDVSLYYQVVTKTKSLFISTRKFLEESDVNLLRERFKSCEECINYMLKKGHYENKEEYCYMPAYVNYLEIMNKGNDHLAEMITALYNEKNIAFRIGYNYINNIYNEYESLLERKNQKRM